MPIALCGGGVRQGLKYLRYARTTTFHVFMKNDMFVANDCRELPGVFDEIA